MKSNILTPNSFFALNKRKSGLKSGSLDECVVDNDSFFGEIKVTRRLLPRICAQSYDRLGIFMSCITTGLKILTCHSCELASINEMDLDLKEKDADFVRVTKNFLQNLQLVHTILPLPQWTCGEGEEIIGIGSTCDGGVPAFGCVNYLICQNISTKEKTSKICCSKSKIS